MTLTDKIMDFSLVWKQASQVFPYFDTIEENWDELYREYLNKAVETTTDREHILLLTEFANRLGDGHTDIQYSKAVLDSNGYLPFKLQYLNGKYYVNYEEVVKINGHPFRELLNQLFRYVYHVGDFVPGYALKKLLPFFLKPTGNVLTTDGGTYPFDLMRDRPPVPEKDHVMLAEYGDILVVQLNSCMYARAAEEIRPTLPGKRAVILDVRENVGGMTMYGARVAELFIPGQFHSCQKRTQKKRGLDLASASQLVPSSDYYLKNGFCDESEVELSKRVWNNREYETYLDTHGGPEHKAVFDGPCVLLTSRATVSAAEDFTAMFRSNHRATIIGSPTCGTTGTPLLQDLSCGSMRICSVGYKLLDGTEFIGKGIQPDICMEPTIADLKQGRDPVLEYALDYLK